MYSATERGYLIVGAASDEHHFGLLPSSNYNTGHTVAVAIAVYMNATFEGMRTPASRMAMLAATSGRPSMLGRPSVPAKNSPADGTARLSELVQLLRSWIFEMLPLLALGLGLGLPGLLGLSSQDSFIFPALY